MAPNPRIGTKIRRAMERKRMNQIQLAEALGVSRSAVNAWINDRAWPQGSIGALEEILGINLDGSPDEPRPISDQLRREIAETLDDPEDQRRVIGLLEGTLTWPGSEPARSGGQAPEREAG